MQTVRLFILGHSYVRDLEDKIKIRSFDLCNYKVVIQYFPLPGATFHRFIQRSDWKQHLLNFKADIVLVVLGGNDISKEISNSEIQGKFKELCQILHNLPRRLIILFSEIEKRRLPDQTHSHLNRFDIPYLDWTKRRRALNNYFNNSKLCHSLVRVAGKGRLDHPNCYKPDGVHLTKASLEKYLNFIRCTIEWLIQKKADLFEHTIQSNRNCESASAQQH